jgi:hypothetical protein
MYTNVLVAALLANVALAAPHMDPASRRKAAAQAGKHSPAFPMSYPTATSTGTYAPTSTGSSGPGSTGGPGAGSGTYTTYMGDGSVAKGWPEENKWVSDFETMWEKNLPVIKQSCTSLHNPPDNTDAENNDLHDAIQSVASSANIDPRFVLAVMMQESSGCVRVHTTTGSRPNPGLMQSDGQATCNSGTPMTPCPQPMIQNMIDDGVNADGGLKLTYAKATGPGNAQKYYQAAYLYNSGINLTPNTKNLAANAATACYASDIANRLTGFVGDSQCHQ